FRSFSRHPQVIALNEHAFFRDVCDVDREASLIEDVSEGDVHAALWGEPDAGLLADLAEPLSDVVREELRYAIVVCDEQIRKAGPAEIGGSGAESPAVAVEPYLARDIFERAVPAPAE